MTFRIALHWDLNVNVWGGIKMYPFLMSHTSYIIDCRTHSRAIEPKRSRHRRKCRLHGRHLPHGPKTKNRPPLPLQAPQAQTTSRSPLCRMLRHAWRYKQISWLLTHTECIEKKPKTQIHTPLDTIEKCYGPTAKHEQKIKLQLLMSTDEPACRSNAIKAPLDHTNKIKSNPPDAKPYTYVHMYIA